MQNLNIKQLMIPSNRYWLKSPHKMEPRGITIHNTANSVSAIREASFSAGNDWEVSSHYYVDEKDIVQSLPLNRNAWHASDGTNGYGNRNTICIEICRSTGDLEQFRQAEKLAAKLIEELLRVYEWDKSVVKRHYDYARDKKYCPHKTMDLGWQRYLDMIGGSMEDIFIMGKPTTDVEQMQAWAKTKNANQEFINQAKTFYDVSVKHGVDPAVTYTQSAKETNYFKFTGVLDISFFNPCGLKTTAGGDNYDKHAHKRFKSWEEGITAQVHHLALYAGAKGYPLKDTPDPRHFPHIFGRAKTVAGLGGNWAPSRTYGNDIEKMVKELRAVKTKTDVITKPAKALLENAVISVRKEAFKFGLDLSKRTGIPLVMWDTEFNYQPYSNVICVGEDTEIKSFTAYMTHFINANDTWSTKRNTAWINSFILNPDNAKRKRG